MPTRILGAILAGGTSSRFGSDKALAIWDGKPLIAHVADSLAPQCDAIVVCGRSWGGFAELADQPRPGLGPMGGLCAALQHAEQTGFDAVLSTPCDMPRLPTDCRDRLWPGPSVVLNQWLLGLWPANLASGLTLTLSTKGAISARTWVSLSGAKARALPFIPNINRPADLNSL